ncbi:MAG TPA: APC family permease [Gemmatimonadales bacterium]|jgi:amino acid transporter|nr:APC family permease [Gemmatimonadales bacterium]
MTTLTPSAAPATAPVELPRVLTLRDLVLFNIVAVLSLRWTATAAAAGPSSLAMWVLAALMFFIPQGLAVSWLSARYPHEGGIYAWTKQAFGEGHGFLCGWCYWVNNILYYPNLLMSTAVIATYMVGRGDTRLMDNWTYIFVATLTSLWLAVWMNVVGLKTGRWLQNLGAVGTYIPGAVLVGFGLHAALTRPSATPITWHSLTPDLGDMSALNLWASIAFAYAGLELCAVMGDEVQNPRRTLPRSIYISAPFIAFLYIAGTLALLWLVPSSEVHIVSGFFQAIAIGARDLGGLAWIIPIAATLYVLGNIGGIGAWLTGPARVAFVIGLDRYFPPAFGRVHPRWKTPYVAILTQAVLATVFLMLSVLGKGTTVEKAYLILLDTMLLVYFIPYIYLFICYLVVNLRESGGSTSWLTGKAIAVIVGSAGLLLTLGAMIVATIPPSDTADPWIFRLKVIGGAALFVVLGGAVYWRGRRTAR